MEPVVVVGAGPIGMTAALALARQRVPSVLIDAAPGLSGEGSKAICVQRDVLDVLDRLGVGRTMADEGVSWTLGRTYFRQRELFQTRLPTGASAFPPFVNLPQCRSEELLLDRVRASDLVDLRWDHRLEALE
jgi:3-(3-hydroxy-phenyl)propionate hydroxylase